jgi:hypothetical protein
MNTNRMRWLGCLGGVWLGACGLPAQDAPADVDVQAIPQPIVGGTRAAECQWPTAVGMPTPGCTATLVHPRIVTTAAHCLADGVPPEVTFGESWRPNRAVRRVKVERCKTAEEGGLAGDFGFCVLAEPVPDLPIVPVLYGCETSLLQPGAHAVLAGFGRLGGFNFTAGTKYFVGVELGAIEGTDIALGNSRAGGCHGDSGGPAYIRLADGSWRVFGATSRGTLFCNGQTIYTLIHPFVAWLERDTGIDITPCHDADGAWNPGPACKSFPLDPDAPGSWSGMCSHEQLSGPGASCGPAAAP